MIEQVGNTELSQKPVDGDTKDTNNGANDLLKAIDSLENGLEDFNKNARQGVLNNRLNELAQTLNELEDLEKRLKELETGVDDTQKTVENRKGKIEKDDPNMP